MESTKVERLFPPRCCRVEIPIDRVSSRLSADEMEDFLDAKAAHHTHNRTYCSNQLCGKFIRQEFVMNAERAECNRCGTATCVHCGKEFHLGECGEDRELQATLNLANGQGWQRCERCKFVVDKIEGCNHITYVSTLL